MSAIDRTSSDSWDQEFVPESWLIVPSELSLPVDRVHVWLACLNGPGIRMEELWGVLDDEERHRANQFRFERDVRRFIATHGILRMIIGRYLKMCPSQLHFDHGIHGKPYLGNLNESNLEFNLSHSENLALFAFTCGQQVGVDIEYIKPIPEISEVAHLVLTEREYELLRAVPEDRKQTTFYKYWTMKEACTKYLGLGLALLPNQFEVLAVDQEVRQFTARHVMAEDIVYSYKMIMPAIGYIGAIVVAGENWNPIYWSWTAFKKKKWNDLSL